MKSSRQPFGRLLSISLSCPVLSVFIFSSLCKKIGCVGCIGYATGRALHCWSSWSHHGLYQDLPILQGVVIRSLCLIATELQDLMMCVPVANSRRARNRTKSRYLKFLGSSFFDDNNSKLQITDISWHLRSLRRGIAGYLPLLWNVATEWSVLINWVTNLPTAVINDADLRGYLPV